MEPRAHSWEANGLTHNVLEWNAAAPALDGGRSSPQATAVIIHGFQDAAATWDDVASILAVAGGLRVLAPDQRGFGDGARVPRGAYYYFPDYIADLAALVRERVAPGAPLLLVGHSMGATIASYFAGALPELPAKVALIDGVGPPDNAPDVAPVRMRGWLDTVAKQKGAAPPSFADIADAAARLGRFNPDIDDATLRRRAAQLLRRDDTRGTLAWKHDPLHATTSPIPFFAESYKAFARRVTCPVLHVSGGARGLHVPDEEARLACFKAMSRVTIEGGHALHWSRPRELGDALVRFWRG